MYFSGAASIMEKTVTSSPKETSGSFLLFPRKFDALVFFRTDSMKDKIEK